MLNEHKTYQQLPLQDPPKCTLIRIFWFEIRPSGNPDGKQHRKDKIGIAKSDIHTYIHVHQGCQMAYFQTKNPTLGKFWRVLQWKMLVYFTAIWYIFTAIWSILRPFGMLYQAKSSNRDVHDVLAAWRIGYPLRLRNRRPGFESSQIVRFLRKHINAVVFN
jgi:hypothetical protein